MFAAQCGGFRFGGFGHQSGVQARARANPIPDYCDEEILVIVQCPTPFYMA